MPYQQEKELVLNLQQALESSGYCNVAPILAKYTSVEYEVFAVHPFNKLQTSTRAAEVIWEPLSAAFSSLQRRQDIFFAGTDQSDNRTWVVSMGNFMGLFDQPWINIPPTNRIAMIRYAEFHCVVNGKITQSALHLDIINLLGQQGIHVLPPETGQSFVYPGPLTHDGINYKDQPIDETRKTLSVLNQMIEDLDELNKQSDQRVPPEFLARSWHDNMAWYGPGGIGASYTIERYQQQHQYPFRENLKNKEFNGHIARVAEGSYAAFFGWPNLYNTPTGGFLGLPGNETRAAMRVVDVYRRDGEKLAENWVFIDLPYWLLQQGLDVLARLKDQNR